ncbi:MAG: glycosyltransferase, partial [Anaerolineales bacterium]|nr:glycosyltransferase [Anaerolineales bacterium]
MKPTIIVVAYNRPHALHRLLTSLRQAEYPPDVTLIISIDAGGEHGRSVHTIAQQFAWSAGEKQVIVRERPFGLTGHVFACGDLTQEIGPIIL